MSIASRLEEIKTAKQNIKEAIQSELGKDLSNVAFVNYHEYITASGGGGGGYCAISLNISYEEKDEYILGDAVTFNGVTKTLDGNTVLANVPITYNNEVVATSGSDGSWSYSTTWSSGGCEFKVVDSTYGVVCKELVYPHEKFYDSFTNLQAKVNALSSGDTLVLDCNYKCINSSDSNNSDGVLITTANVTIDGSKKYILDGNQLGKMLKINASGVVVTGLILKNGNGYFGGAIQYDGDCTVSDCTFTGNTARYGGGAIYGIMGTVSDCTFTGNSSQSYGGAISNMGGTVSDCTFTNNTASGNGGAIYNHSECAVSDCTFTGNTASGNGGAIYNSYAKCIITDSIFIGNTATNGMAELYTTYQSIVSGCYWGVNNPNFEGQINMDKVTMPNYARIEINNQELDFSEIILIEANPYDTITSTLGTSHNPIGDIEAVITVGSTTYNEVFHNGKILLLLDVQSKPYTVTAKLGNGETISKTIEA